MARIEVGEIRNVAVVGHGAVGKTTLVDSLLFHAKAVDRKGSVDDGSSILDFDDDEKKHKHTLFTSLARLEWKGKKFHILDTPGYPDFLGHAVTALHNVETTLIAIDAHKGVEVNTRRMYEEANKSGVAKVIVLTKMGGEAIDFEALITQIKETFGKQCVLFQVPIGIGPTFEGLIDVLHDVHESPEGALRDPSKTHEAIVERIVETDDEALEKYLEEGETPPPDRMREILTAAVCKGKITPILCCSSKLDLGLDELLDMLVEFAPAPGAGNHRSAIQDEKEFELDPDPEKPFVARVFKTMADKFGNLTYIRVYQGLVHGNSTIKVARDGSSHRLGQLNLVEGKNLEKIDEAGPGMYVAIPKVEGVEINDTFSTDGDIAMPPVEFPDPMFPVAVGAKERSDDAKVVMALRKMAHEDPCLTIDRDDQTLETILHGLSQLHLDVVLDRIKTRDGLEVDTHDPKIPYKETISQKGEASFRHKKQTGGSGQFAEVHLRLSPRNRGEGFEFVDSVVGGSIPGQYIPAVEKGIRETMKKGILSGSEIVDLTADVFFGKDHPVDSSEQAFKFAASVAFKEAFLSCSPVLLEPIVDLEVVIPPDKMGDVTGHLNTKRAHITGMEVAPGGLQIVRAKAPLAEMLRYQTELKSMTGGQGSFSMHFSHLDPVPHHVQQQVVAKHEAKEAS